VLLAGGVGGSTLVTLTYIQSKSYSSREMETNTRIIKTRQFARLAL
jgi:hypothetical protein